MRTLRDTGEYRYKSAYPEISALGVRGPTDHYWVSLPTRGGGDPPLDRQGAGLSVALRMGLLVVKQVTYTPSPPPRHPDR